MAIPSQNVRPLPRAILLVSLRPASACGAAERDTASDGERVADWELAHPESRNFPLTNPADTKPLGWVMGAFYTGLTALADPLDPIRDMPMRLSRWASKIIGRWDPALSTPTIMKWRRAGSGLRPQTRSPHDRRGQRALRCRHCRRPVRFVADDAGARRLFQQMVLVRCALHGSAGWVALSRATQTRAFSPMPIKEYRATTDFLLDADATLFYRDSSYFGKTGRPWREDFLEPGQWVGSMPGWRAS